MGRNIIASDFHVNYLSKGVFGLFIMIYILAILCTMKPIKNTWCIITTTNIIEVPTFGKIWKIIDFGRAIYRYKDQTMFSDSFSQKGDASTQYNCPPYYNENKKKVMPNFSFDLCRLGCSLFDHFFIDEDFKTLHEKKMSSVERVIYEWCLNDSNKNMLVKKNGDERYPDFKLYKMITRSVTRHIPRNQLEREIFSKYIVSKKIVKKKKIMDIDQIPNYYTKN